MKNKAAARNRLTEKLSMTPYVPSPTVKHSMYVAGMPTVDSYPQHGHDLRCAAQCVGKGYLCGVAELIQHHGEYKRGCER